VPATFFAIDRLAAATGFAPTTPLGKDCSASWRGISTTIAPADRLARHVKSTPRANTSLAFGRMGLHDSGTGGSESVPA
jgi:hypothetical protein